MRKGLKPDAEAGLFELQGRQFGLDLGGKAIPRGPARGGESGGRRIVIRAGGPRPGLVGSGGFVGVFEGEEFGGKPCPRPGQVIGIDAELAAHGAQGEEALLRALQALGLEGESFGRGVHGGDGLRGLRQSPVQGL